MPVSPADTVPFDAASAGEMRCRFEHIRRFTRTLVEPLTPDDCMVQSMPDASPAKWHLAHTAWFFETLVLKAAISDYQPLDPQFEFLFNSYYNTIGPQYEKPKRCLLSRPTLDEVLRYREGIDERMLALLHGAERDVRLAAFLPLIELGLNHEQQHQELILADIKHAFACNPLRPAYGGSAAEAQRIAARPAVEWLAHEAGVYWIGFEGGGFCYDNERPQHRVFLDAFALASRLVTCGEYLAFMEDGGYRRPELWLSDGWAAASAQQWIAPLYWQREDDRWMLYTLGGMRAVDPHEPVGHVSFYEADAYARWADARLPTEQEWEACATTHGSVGEGNFIESGRMHPVPAGGLDARLPKRGAQFFGDVWEWTASPYVAYPGYRPPPGAVGEYNAKFMCNQMVLRGGSCATPQSHIRATYRNFFPPHARWQFTGIRVARK
jgi:ergothioneine biosynthesis protein EgtB